MVDTDDEVSPTTGSSHAGPSNARQPRAGPPTEKKSKLQERQRVALRGWRKRMVGLWDVRKTLPREELNGRMMQVLDEIYEVRWSLLLGDIAEVKLVALLKKLSSYAVFDDRTANRADHIRDAFLQRFAGRSLFQWEGTKIVQSNNR